MPATKIIIDTDPGVDDAMAIFMALASPEFEVLALTTVFGNADTATTTVNALRLLEIAGRDAIPVSAGAATPLVATFHGGASVVHGEDGQGNTFLPAPQGEPTPASAATTIIGLADAHPGEVTLVALGPLTNVAVALRADPLLDRKLAAIVLMGGSAFSPGNITPAAEANVFNDAEAADIVFGARCPVVMAGLDVTQRVLLDGWALGSLATIGTATADHLARITPFYAAFQERSNPGRFYVHDSTALAYMLWPDRFGWIERPVRVDTGASVCRGKTLVAGDRDVLGLFVDRPAVRVLTEVDGVAVAGLMMERITG